MKGLDIPLNDAVLVGSGSSDDAGVYKLTSDIALVQTVDFITPIVDDPFTYGRIAACNSLSDVYAMGGRPITALNVVCFPTKLFSLDKMTEILKGGLSVLSSVDVQLLGGHSVEDNELKYGLSVTGLVHPDRILMNNTIKAGDAIILTKPIGTGIIATAVKAGISEDEHYEPFIQTMTMLNNSAAEVMSHYPVSACTDVTGFGLVGHLREMLGNNTLSIVVDSSSISYLPGAMETASMGMIPAGMYRNKDYVGDVCEVCDNVEREKTDVLFDPQTSGGLLIAVNTNDAHALVTELHDKGVTDAHIIAVVEERATGKIVIS